MHGQWQTSRDKLVTVVSQVWHVTVTPLNLKKCDKVVTVTSLSRKNRDTLVTVTTLSRKNRDKLVTVTLENLETCDKLVMWQTSDMTVPSSLVGLTCKYYVLDLLQTRVYLKWTKMELFLKPNKFMFRFRIIYTVK